MRVFAFKVQREFLLEETTMGEIQEEIKEDIEVPHG